MFRKRMKFALITLVVLLLVSQVIRPQRTNPTIDAANTIEAQAHVKADVASILHRACGDCHSYQTVWPWYTNVAPVSWLVVNDVNGGRSHMNLSAWVRPGKRTDLLPAKMCEEVQSGGMPLYYYLWMHHDARLSKEDVSTICAWANQASPAAPAVK